MPLNPDGLLLSLRMISALHRDWFNPEDHVFIRTANPHESAIAIQFNLCLNLIKPVYP